MPSSPPVKISHKVLWKQARQLNGARSLTTCPLPQLHELAAQLEGLLAREEVADKAARDRKCYLKRCSRENET